MQPVDAVDDQGDEPELIQRLDALHGVARALVAKLADPKEKTAAERAEKREQAKAALLLVLDAIAAQARASEAYAAIAGTLGGHENSAEPEQECAVP
jgi:hypothetical protein